MIKAIFGVAIIGGGVGGLCLAQGLKQAGMNVAVYERDESPSARPQGFRIHIDPEGSKALHQCLPADLWNIFDLTGGDFAQGFTVLTEQLDELLSFRNEGGPPEPIARHRAISRIRLRQILLSGLGDSVKFGKRFVRYEETSHHRIVAHFEDGSTAEASILVGADGVNSPVRKQFLPHADPIHTTVAAIGGKIPLTDGVLALAPDRLLDGPVMVIPPDPCSLFMAFWKQPRESAEVLRRLQIEEELIDDPDYLTFGLGATADHLGLSGDLRATPGSELKKILRRSVAHWNPRLRKLAEMVDEKEMTCIPIRTSHAPEPWKPSHITLLGDAIHSMTPYRGIGANVALRDAALLCAKLTEAAKGQQPLLEAIGEYETSMRKYAFEAVASSLKAMHQTISQKKNPGFQLVKTAMRVVNRLPALKRRFAAA